MVLLRRNTINKEDIRQDYVGHKIQELNADFTGLECYSNNTNTHQREKGNGKKTHKYLFFIQLLALGAACYYTYDINSQLDNSLSQLLELNNVMSSTCMI